MGTSKTFIPTQRRNLIRNIWRIFFTACLFQATFVTAQDWQVRGGLVYGSYSMKGLKELQNSLLHNANFVPAKTVETFPGRIGYDLAIRLSFIKAAFEVSYSFNSTAGRIHYGDYSGELKLDQLISSNSIAASAMVKLNPGKKYDIYLGIRTGLCFSNLGLKNSVSVNEQVIEKESYSLQSINLFTSPFLEFQYPFHQIVIFSQLRYEIHIVKSPLTVNGDGDQYITISSDEKLKADWDGIRLALGVGYTFKRK